MCDKIRPRSFLIKSLHGARTYTGKFVQQLHCPRNVPLVATATATATIVTCCCLFITGCSGADGEDLAEADETVHGALACEGTAATATAPTCTGADTGHSRARVLRSGRRRGRSSRLATLQFRDDCNDKVILSIHMKEVNKEDLPYAPFSSSWQKV